MNLDDIKNVFKDTDNVVNIKQINNSFSQKVYYVEGNKKYILKMYENKLKFENELKYLNYFKEKLNVPYVYKHSTYNDEFYIIMEYIEGLSFKDEDDFKLEDEIYKKTGILLAHMHSLKPIDENKWNEYMLYRVEKNHQILKSKNINLDKCYNYLKETISDLNYDESCMHSDFRIGNLIFNEDVYLLDLESTKTGDSVFDFVKMSRVLNIEQFKLLLEGYKTIHHLPDNFEERLHFYNLYDAFTTMGWCIEVDRYQCDFYELNLSNLKKELNYIWEEEVIQTDLKEARFSLK